MNGPLHCAQLFLAVCIACVAAGDCLAQGVPVAPGMVAATRQDTMHHIPFIGKTVEEVRQYEFFTFFHLEKVKE